MLLMIAGRAATAQPYQSLFGKDSTRQNMAWLQIDFTKSDSIHVEKDTLVNGYTWKKLKNNLPGFYRGGLIREDTVIGKVWYKSLGSTDTAAVLAFDFALNKGDTFDISNRWGNYTVAQMIVDTTYYYNGRKIIEFKATLSNLQLGERIRFIEGVGSNIGWMYKDKDGYVFLPYLLCSFKDGIQTYSNSLFFGQCWVLFTATQEVPDPSKISVHPTLFTDRLILDNNSSTLITRVLILNSAGCLVYTAPYRRDFYLPSLPPGLYFISLCSEKGRVYSKKIIRR